MGDECYSDEELVSCINDLFSNSGIQASLQHMKTLQPTWVQSVYSRFCLEYNAAPDMNVIPMNAPESVYMFKDAYSGIIPLAGLYRIVSYFVRAANAHWALELSDLYNPKPLRTRYFFSHLLQMYINAAEVFSQN